MKQVILLEHFKNNVRPNMKFEIMRADVWTVMEAGRKADQLEAAYGVFRKDVGDRSNVVNPPRFKGGWSNAPARVHPSDVKFANNHDAASLNNSTQGQIVRS